MGKKIKAEEEVKKEAKMPKPSLPQPAQPIKTSQNTVIKLESELPIQELDQNKNKTLGKGSVSVPPTPQNAHAPPPLTLPPAPSNKTELKPTLNGSSSTSVIVTTAATTVTSHPPIQRVHQPTKSEIKPVQAGSNQPVHTVSQTVTPVSVTSKSVLYSKQPSGIILHNVVTPTVQIVQNPIGQNPKSPSFSRFGMADILNNESSSSARQGVSAVNSTSTTDVTPAGNNARSGTPSHKPPVRSSIESPRGSTSSFEHPSQQYATYQQNQQKTEHLQRQILKQPTTNQTHYIGKCHKT